MFMMMGMLIEKYHCKMDDWLEKHIADPVKDKIAGEEDASIALGEEL